MARPSHRWSLPTQHLRIDEAEDEAAFGGTLLLPEEAERLVESLRRQPVATVGTPAWMAQHQVLQRLNMQAHASAKSNSDEFVVEALLTFDKVEVLVHELLVVEAWKEHALPRIAPGLAKGPASMRCYFVLYHEAVLCNLMETLLYHDYGVAALGDLSVELVDYCGRKLTRLNCRHGLERPLTAGMDAEEASSNTLLARAEARAAAGADEELGVQAQEVELSVCLSALRLARFLAEHLDKLPLGAFNRLLETHDVLMLTLPLLDNPPWTRRRREAVELENTAPLSEANAEDEGEQDAKKKKKKKKRGKTVWEKLDADNRWQKVEPADLLKLTPLEVNAWLIVFFLTCSQEVRKGYHLNSFRKQSLLRVRKFINEVVLDQLPVLADVQRLMDELAVVDVPEPSGLDTQGLMMQQVAREREGLVTGTDWEVVAKEALETSLSAAAGAGDLTQLADMYTGDDVLDFLEPRGPGEEAGETQEELVERIVRETQAKADASARGASTSSSDDKPKVSEVAEGEGKPQDKIADAASPAPPAERTEKTAASATEASASPHKRDLLPPVPDPVSAAVPVVPDLDSLWDEAVDQVAEGETRQEDPVDEEIDLTDPDALD